MTEQNSPPWRLIPSREVSRLLGVSIQVFTNWRMRGTGPSFDDTIRGEGNKVFYRRADVLAWLGRERGEPQEGWEICRDWLAERGIGMENPTPDGVWWLAKMVDSVSQ